MILQHQDNIIDTRADNIIQQALYLGDPDLFNTTRDDCVWKRGNNMDKCPDPDIKIIMYTSGQIKEKIVVSNYLNVFRFVIDIGV